MVKKIFFVEDDQDYFDIYSVPLKNAGHEVIHISDGAKVVDKVLMEMPDLVLLDIILPGVSGLDILKELKERPETKSIKIVMLTNFGGDENSNKALGYGADDFLTKDFLPDELLKKITRYL